MAIYTYKFTPSKKLDAKTTRLAVLSVFDEKGKIIGTYQPSTWENHETCVKMVVREYELTKAFKKVFR